MKRLLILISLIAIGYFGYTYYKNSKSVLPPDLSNRMDIKQTGEGDNDLLTVLGATTSRIISQGTNLLNNATDGQAEPIINKAVSDLQNRVKELPEEQYKKVKYEFCKDVLPSASPESNTDDQI